MSAIFRYHRFLTLIHRVSPPIRYRKEGRGAGPTGRLAPQVRYSSISSRPGLSNGQAGGGLARAVKADGLGDVRMGLSWGEGLARSGSSTGSERPVLRAGLAWTVRRPGQVWRVKKRGSLRGGESRGPGWRDSVCPIGRVEWARRVAGLGAARPLGRDWPSLSIGMTRLGLSCGTGRDGSDLARVVMAA